jgi:MYXO-CTERM domain-containing protein
MTMALDVFNSVGDGIVTEADRGAGSFFARATINDVSAGWYTPNQYGGFMADTHVDITALVNNARMQSEQFISIRLGVPVDAPWLRGLFRTPAVISSDEPILSVPGPSAAGVLVLAGALGRRRRREGSLVT